MRTQAVILDSGTVVTSSRLREIRTSKEKLLAEIQDIELQIQHLEEEEKSLKFRLGYKFR